MVSLIWINPNLTRDDQSVVDCNDKSYPVKQAGPIFMTFLKPLMLRVRLPEEDILFFFCKCSTDANTHIHVWNPTLGAPLRE